jgi:hypothetical protein
MEITEVYGPNRGSVEVDIDFQHRVAKLYDSSSGRLELSCLEHGE